MAVISLAVPVRSDYEHRDHHYGAKKYSIFVHAADSYLHIATEAVNLAQIFPQSPVQHQSSRVVDHWCFDNRETIGTERNKNFWGCALTVGRGENGTDDTPREIIFNNQSSIDTVIDEGYSKFIMNFIEQTGTKFAVVGPTTSPSDAD
jgi:hypothetical protein